MGEDIPNQTGWYINSVKSNLLPVFDVDTRRTGKPARQDVDHVGVDDRVVAAENGNT